MAKPAGHINWTDGDPSKVTQPSASKMLIGWLSGERPAFQFFNWLFWRIDAWLKYFEQVTDATQSGYDWVVAASGGSHATLAAAMADVNVLPNHRILVKDPEDISTTVEVSKTGLYIDFHPLATFTDDGAGTALRISGVRIVIKNARFENFTLGIELQAISKNCRVQDCNFDNTVTTDITDAGDNNLKLGNLREVV